MGLTGCVTEIVKIKISTGYNYKNKTVQGRKIKYLGI